MLRVIKFRIVYKDNIFNTLTQLGGKCYEGMKVYQISGTRKGIIVSPSRFSSASIFPIIVVNTDILCLLKK